jgi:hypothetical protein
MARNDRSDRFEVGRQSGLTKSVNPIDLYRLEPFPTRCFWPIFSEKARGDSLFFNGFD